MPLRTRKYILPLIKIRYSKHGRIGKKKGSVQPCKLGFITQGPKPIKQSLETRNKILKIKQDF
jgi:hypothetical protein